MDSFFYFQGYFSFFLILVVIQTFISIIGVAIIKSRKGKSEFVEGVIGGGATAVISALAGDSNNYFTMQVGSRMQ